MTVYRLYGVKSDHSKIEVIGRQELSDFTVGLTAAFAKNNGTTSDDVSEFDVVTQSEIDRLASAQRPQAFTWDDDAPDGEITGMDWTTDDGIKFGLRAVWDSGKVADANDGKVYLRTGQDVTVVFEVWALVDGLPDAKISGGPQGDIPILVDGKQVRLHIDTTAGTSEDWTFTHHGDLSGWGQVICPQPGYVNARYKVFDTPVIIHNSIEPSET